MSAFLVDPMDAQKPWQRSLGPLLRLWTLGQRIHFLAPKLAKSPTKPNDQMEGNGGHDAMLGINSADVSLPCGPNGCLKVDR